MKQSGFLKLVPFMVLLIVLLFCGSCATKTAVEEVRDEVAAAKGEIEKLKNTVATKSQELNVLQGNVDLLRQEIKEIKDSQRASQEKSQNTIRKAKPKSKKKH